MPTLLLTAEDTAVPGLRARLASFARATTRTVLRLDSRNVGLPGRYYYTTHRSNHSGNENHVQGIALSGDGSFLAVSGSNWKEPAGDLLVFGLSPAGAAARPTHGFARLALDSLLWHAGGIDACGSIVAVALEYPHYTRFDPKRFAGRVQPPQHGSGDRSRIQLVELGPVPRPLPVALHRDGILATCVGITRLLDGRLMLLVLARDKVPEPHNGDAPSPAPLRVDCYLSQPADPLDIRPHWSETVDASALPACQSWSLLTDRDTGLVVLAVFSGDLKGKVVPFAIEGPDARPQQWKPLPQISVNVGPGDFRAGGTLAYAGGELRLLAVDRYRDARTGELRVTELLPAAPPAVVVRDPTRPVLVSRQRGKRKTKTRKLVALRDTLDFRDLMYVPTLIEVPPQRALQEYLREAPRTILDQGETSECTGYALATVIHHLLRHRGQPAPRSRSRASRDTTCVSAAMLYTMAKRYDEWGGVDYDGSSCRGAMKAWHKHGACRDRLWKEEMLDGGWDDARTRPLGAYFRVNHHDLVAMHAALAETGILYGSVVVHSGWSDVGEDGIIPYRTDREGGHAVAIVAYDEFGFWLQNSWGDDWGRGGFARISYDDWLENAMDVWVARLGAPVRVGERAATVGLQPSSQGSRAYFFQDLRPHVISTGNDGAFRTSGTYGTDARDAERLLGSEFVARTEGWSRRRLLLYAHGGLVGEDTAIQRLSDYLAPLTRAEVYPLSFIWKTDLWTTLGNLLKDALQRRRPEGPLDRLKDFMLDRLDDALEPIARAAGGAGIWEEMKENAELTARATQGAFRTVAPLLARLKREYGDEVELHLVAHSAGSIYFARLVQWLTAARKARVFGARLPGLATPIDSITLWAPAITLDLFAETYLPALRAGAIGRLTLFTLDDETERADHCARIYHKSLLYLVSHALEARPRGPLAREGEPLLGLERSIEGAHGRAVRELIASGRIEWIRAPQTAAQPESQADAHGAFDDDVATVRATLRRILSPGAAIPSIEFARSASSRRDRRRQLEEVSG